MFDSIEEARNAADYTREDGTEIGAGVDLFFVQKDAEYVLAEPDVGISGGWEVTAELIGGAILGEGDRVFLNRAQMIALLGADAVKRHEGYASEEMTERHNY